MIGLIDITMIGLIICLLAWSYRDCRVSDDSLWDLPPSLVYLDLTQCYFITDAGLQVHTRTLPPAQKRVLGLPFRILHYYSHLIAILICYVL